LIGRGSAVSVWFVGETKLICFDCDSTLSAIEGIDELARAAGSEVFARVEEMTNDAMNGKIPVEAVFARRLELIQPRREHVEAVGRRYVETIEPTARSTVAALVGRGWTPVILSGGFRQAIAPLAKALNIARVEAVDLFFNPDGSYRGFDAGYPTTRSGGKPEVIGRLKAELRPTETIMVGDGASDLEAGPQVTRFIGFGRYVQRKAVQAGAAAFVKSLDELLGLI
jgi:phosphoserine phosphatase